MDDEQVQRRHEMDRQIERNEERIELLERKVDLLLEFLQAEPGCRIDYQRAMKESLETASPVSQNVDEG